MLLNYNLLDSQAIRYSRDYKKKYDNFRAKLRKPVKMLPVYFLYIWLFTEHHFYYFYPRGFNIIFSVELSILDPIHEGMSWSKYC